MDGPITAATSEYTSISMALYAFRKHDVIYDALSSYTHFDFWNL
jgi:hypothetical protein